MKAKIEAPQLRPLKEAQPEPSTSQKGSIFVKGCESHQGDFRSPSVDQIADFLLHLIKERNLQPSIIEGYRTVLADMVGNDELNISKENNLTHLLDSFHRDQLKGGWGRSLLEALTGTLPAD